MPSPTSLLHISSTALLVNVLKVAQLAAQKVATEAHPLSGILSRRAYSYLPRSVAAVPQGEDMLTIFRRAGFGHCYCRRLTFGACTIYIGEK